MLFSFGKIQAVMGCQHLADLFIPVTVDMICDDELRVLDSHQFHIVVWAIFSIRPSSSRIQYISSEIPSFLYIVFVQKKR